MDERLKTVDWDALFTYSDGRLYWKTARGMQKAGALAGYTDKRGYVYVTVNKTSYQAHRVVYYMHHGVAPKMVDHINGIKNDNRIENLRPADDNSNQWNSKLSIANTSGAKGVTWHKRDKRWQVKCVYKGVAKYLGQFVDYEEAVKTAKDFRTNFHGEYANHG